MGPIFNKKVAKKYNLWDREQYTYALFTVDKVIYCGLKKKKMKKTWRRNVDMGFIANQTVTQYLKIYLIPRASLIFLYYNLGTNYVIHDVI